MNGFRLAAILKNVRTHKGPNIPLRPIDCQQQAAFHFTGIKFEPFKIVAIQFEGASRVSALVEVLDLNQYLGSVFQNQSEVWDLQYFFLAYIYPSRVLLLEYFNCSEARGHGLEHGFGSKPVQKCIIRKRAQC